VILNTENQPVHNPTSDINIINRDKRICISYEQRGGLQRWRTGCVNFAGTALITPIHPMSVLIATGSVPSGMSPAIGQNAGANKI
jgi:hypothetical protein